MKKLLIPIALFALLPSCKKADPTYCWNCATDVKNGGQLTETYSTICNKSAAEIQKIEADGTSGTATGYTTLTCAQR